MLNRMKRLRAVLMPLVAIFGMAIWLGSTGNPSSAQIRTSRKLAFDKKFLSPDPVTEAARKSSNELVSIPVSNESDRVLAASLGTVVQDFGYFVLIYGNSRKSASRSGEGVVKIDSTIHLPGGIFEPVRNPPDAFTSGSLPRFGNGYYVVQLAGIATDEVLDSIRALGLEVLQYVPNNAFFVYGDAEAAARLSAHSRVRWIGEYTADQRIANNLKNVARISDGQSAMFNISVFSRADLDEAAENILNASGGRLLAKMPLGSSYFNVVRVEMNADAVQSVAAVSDVVAVDSYETPSLEDERSSQIVAGNYFNPTSIAGPGYDPLTQFGVSGINVTVAVADDGVSIPGNGGFYLTAANTVNGPLQGAAAGAGGGHGHLNASIIAGHSPFGIFDSFSYNYGLGIAPNAHIVNIPFLKNGYPLNDALAANDAVTTAGPNGAKAAISNNSWGDGLNNNAYESLAATYDSLSRDASFAATIDPLLFVFSAGNNGSSGLTRPKMAKNIIAVGNSENIRSVTLSTGGSIVGDSMDDLDSVSARGPAADGRIKPDITAPGSVITGSRAGNCTTIRNCFDPNHAVGIGTSHAAPQIAGVAALFTEYWKSTHSGTNPSIALTKAAILQSGQDMSGAGTALAVPNKDEGWGRANMKFMLNTGVPVRYVDQTVQFGAPGQQVVYSGEIIDSSKPFRATLVWTDPAGVVDPALVNNLDLTVTVGGTTYRGNVFSGGASVTGGVADTRNNVEQVWRTGAAAGSPVTVTVSSTAINGDGVLGNADATDQHFALIVYNFAGRFSVAGRVVDENGRAVSAANVSLFNGPTLIARMFTNSFGYYRFSNVLGGASYNLVVGSKRYVFNPQLVSLDSSDLDSVNFTATSGP
jgi:hypothetical protein